MSITIAYTADSVGPVCRRIAAYDERFRVVQDDTLTEADVAPQPFIQQAPPADPLLSVWQGARELADVFMHMQPGTRDPIIYDAVDTLTAQLLVVRGQMLVPAPVAPPPVQAERNVLIRWGSRWPGAADITINTAEAVRMARDKRQSRRLLRGLCPTTWDRRGDVQVPCVIRPRRHHAAHGFHVCRSIAEVPRAIARCGLGWYASELIEKVNEYRVFVFQGRVIRVSEKLPPTVGRAVHDVAWNLANGGHSRTLKRKAWPITVAVAAIRAANRLGLDWTAVDVGVARDGRVVVFEANTAPGLTNPNTIEQIAFAFASVLDNPHLAPLDISQPLTWRELIHPSLRPEAAPSGWELLPHLW